MLTAQGDTRFRMYFGTQLRWRKRDGMWHVFIVVSDYTVQPVVKPGGICFVKQRQALICKFSPEAPALIGVVEESYHEAYGEYVEYMLTSTTTRTAETMKYNFSEVHDG